MGEFDFKDLCEQANSSHMTTIIHIQCIFAYYFAEYEYTSAYYLDGIEYEYNIRYSPNFSHYAHYTFASPIYTISLDNKSFMDADFNFI